ncbi:MAG: hypothetical protein IT384_27740 [Deltaproteobacteria bacterium]|nr:hypothetical protein [Deltaproteobacteria bacterium]
MTSVVQSSMEQGSRVQSSMVGRSRERSSMVGRSRERRIAVDQFRGFAVLLMLPANYLEHIRAVPAWLKHAPDIGLTVVDFIAPLFVFAIGLTFGTSVRRRLSRDGWQPALEHVTKRAMALLGIGMLFSIGESCAGYNAHGILWGTLQAIGAAIMLSLPLLWVPVAIRLPIAVGLAGAYQWALDHFWLEIVLMSSHAGIQGSLSWAALLLFATIYADLQSAPRKYLGLAVLMVGAGLALSPLFPISKHRMSISFDLVISGASALLFRLFERLEARDLRAPWLSAWGRNPLALYISHLILLSVFLVPSVPWWHVEAPLWLAAVQGVVFVGVLHRWARFLEARGIFVSL